MRRVIRVSAQALAVAAFGHDDGFDMSEVSVINQVVQVDWPELQLSDEQITANAAALAAGLPTPYPDLSIFVVELPVIRATR